MIDAQLRSLIGHRNRALLSLVYDFLARRSGKSWPVAVQYSGHSLRIGAAQGLLIKGHDTLAIMRAAGWRSLDSVNGYLKFAEHNVWAS